ncbi:MAG: thiamine pyrophosphate-dependent enzyme [Myxococcales bacterium]|nr:thiamine pyrophosphate-dependent enzyme [Myxococcales bacterium]
MTKLPKAWYMDGRLRHLALADYEGTTPRWCPGCGDHAALATVQRLLRDEQIPPDQAVVVSGIGCSSRFPHYIHTYGFHGLHGRPLPIAEGVRARRPDLHLFVVTGDGDCCAIGTAHWIHSIRYNMKMTVMLFDNNIYGLTKMQTSPTTPKGGRSNTHPEGAPLSPLNPLSITLSIANVSFVAQTADWVPAHFASIVKRAHAHPGLAFIRVLQRCPHYMDHHWEPIQSDPRRQLLLFHPEGVPAQANDQRAFPERLEHDPSDLARAREVASRTDVWPLGVLYRNPCAERYDLDTAVGLGMSGADKLAALERELTQFEV